MHISGLTSSQVWLSSSRSLTNIGSGALAPTSTVFTSIAGSASVDFRPSVGIIANETVGVITGVGATAATLIQLSDGTNTINAASTAAAASSPAAFSGFATNGVWLKAINTDATHAASYLLASYSWTI